MIELTTEILERLSKPFPPDVIEWKPGATNQGKTKALALAYVEVRHYIERLNEVIGPNWHDDYDFIGATGGLVLCHLTVCGVTRSDIGEKGESDVNTATSAVAQGFKRACVKFGLGTHLYRMPRVWVEYDSQYKKFTPGALANLRRLASEDGGGNGSGPQPQVEQHDNKRAKLIARLHELVAESTALNHPVNLDQSWLDSATEAELTAFGIELAGEVDKLKESGGNGDTPRKVIVHASGWKAAADKLAHDVPYYQKDSKPNYYRMTGAAGKKGFDSITDDNLDEVIASLREYAARQLEKTS